MTDSRAAHWRRGATLTTFVSLALLLAWDASGLDLPLAHFFGDAGGFAYRDTRWLVVGLHEGPRLLGWLALGALFAAIRWPVGALRRLTAGERAWLAVSVLAALIAVTLLKRGSTTSCPWDLQAFGGSVPYVSHWWWGQSDGGGGHCFPAGHASTGFAWLAGFFALRDRAPRAARWWLVGALVVGLLLGAVQQLRGAHYMSHTLWTAWICWTVGAALDTVRRLCAHLYLHYGDGARHGAV